MENEISSDFYAELSYSSGTIKIPKEYIKSIKNGVNKPNATPTQFAMDTASDYIEITLYGAKGVVNQQKSVVSILTDLLAVSASDVSLTYYIPVSSAKPQSFVYKIKYFLTFAKFQLPEVNKEVKTAIEYKLYFSYTNGSIEIQSGPS